MRRGIMAVGAVLVLATGVSASSAAAAVEFANWTAVDENVASGTLRGASVSLAGTFVRNPPGSVVDGSSSLFNSPAFSPPLAASDAIEFGGFKPGYSYTLSFGTPATDPILHLFSLDSVLEFPPDTSVTKVSGDSALTVADNTVAGAPDANGTVRLNGTFSSVEFTATTADEVNQPDGIDIQVGVKLPPPPPPDTTPPDTAITKGPAEGSAVGDAPPPFEFASDDPGARFECRTYDPAKNDPFERVFKPCASPHQRLDLIRAIALGERSAFEVRAIDPAGNADPTPAVRRYRKHGKLGKRPVATKCQPVTIATVHGRGVRSNCRIVEIKRGKVPCVNVRTYKVRKCPFRARAGRSRTGAWIKAKRTGKKYALVGRFIRLKGRHRGLYAIAAPVGNPKASPCGVAPRASTSDSAAPSLGTPLATACTPETVNAATNATGLSLDNYATRTVCGSEFSEADVSSSFRVTSPAPGVYCYTGEGAGLNDPNGTERDYNGRYWNQSARCHVIISNGVEVYAAKRPATNGLPLRADSHSKVVWRPVAPIAIAN